ncbi:aminoglycoside phosphotransferase family protein [Deinococcus cellulosilyticus]|uniref:Aminoglycoside phosphotransferase n=1 Tax=Deinococcus cellulosilyticus (strain DSM 18568 / NBRC 106333 / KACC 11606 / 5516J-15) TaxID=1223518 RepID=A0A511N876_DEIC1|nr:aminoglycoside phosphotransferase family protein [Deinococcus cellulosilyticus]GEM49035.1 aminoglycoside phosphotransferase [Deinococcus cellulosilyticus NBRC 106333 = KACC 11606]
MHEHEVNTSEDLVQRLLDLQFPEYAHLPLKHLESSGTDHRMYRLGEDLVVRLPKVSWATPQMGKEHHWLPRLAPHLPLTIPTPVAQGVPAEGYPWNWSIYKWIEGENATLDRMSDSCQTARKLAEFVLALQSIDPTGGPLPGDHNFGRGVPLQMRDGMTRHNISQLEGWFDVQALTDAWERALNAPVWEGEGVWLHGDLQAGNLLAKNGTLHAVIDFGGLAIGDPACDLMVAWNLFDAKSRQVYRQALGVDNATWERGKGWALSVAVVALPYYRHTNPGLVAISEYALQQVLADAET